MEPVNTSEIMGLATDMSPMPPVASSVEVVKSSQNCGVRITLATFTLEPPLESALTAGGVQPAGTKLGPGFLRRKADVPMVPA